MTMAERGTRVLSRMHASLCTCVSAYPRESLGARRLGVCTNAQPVRIYPASFDLEFFEA
jgi:hypothetical protein